MSTRIIFDEASTYLGGQNDALIRELREIEGVPNATYLVKDGLVFVFDKLVQLVVEQRYRNPDLSLSELAPSLVSKSMVSAKDAVEYWGVVPEPYDTIETSSGIFIHHRPFNALLPGAYDSKREVQSAFVRILLGEVLAKGGDFTYRGQQMALCETLDMSQLPTKPHIQRMMESDYLGFIHLQGVAYQSGFEPVPESLFNETKRREEEWANDCASAFRYAENYAKDLWNRASELRLETLDGSKGSVSKYNQMELDELRSFYPELSMLSDGSLYEWYVLYQVECCSINGWTASRDNDFLFYLLGNISGIQHEGREDLELGKWIAYALLRGDSLDVAISFGRDAILYDSAISYLASRIASAMRFLVEDMSCMGQRGQKIKTFQDVLCQGRSS